MQSTRQRVGPPHHAEGTRLPLRGSSPNPAHRLRAARRQLMTCLIELGLTPVSTNRTHALPTAKKKSHDGLASYFSNSDPLKPAG
jgi:phage terminase small subunit